MLTAERLYAIYNDSPGHRFDGNFNAPPWAEAPAERRQAWEDVAAAIAADIAEQAKAAAGAVIDDESLKASNRHVPHTKHKAHHAGH